MATSDHDAHVHTAIDAIVADRRTLWQTIRSHHHMCTCKQCATWNQGTDILYRDVAQEMEEDEERCL